MKQVAFAVACAALVLVLIIQTTTVTSQANNEQTQLTAEQKAEQHRQSFFNLKSFFTNITGQQQQQQQQRSPFSDRKCLMCRFSVSLINYALKTRRGYHQIDRLANSFCTAAHLESPAVCSQVSKLFNHEITKVLTYGIVTPNQVCGLLSNNTCGHFHSPLDDWEVNLNASYYLSQAQVSKLRKKQQKQLKDLERDAAPYRVIHISDTHIDLKYKPGAPVNCQEPLCCQNTSTAASNVSSGAAGHWGAYGLCDVPLWTVEATLKFLGQQVKDHKDIEYIIWTGDIQPHDVWAQNRKTAIEIYDAIFAKIFEYLPNIKILPTLGNHEMIPVDSFSPSNLLDIAKDDSPVWVYKKLDSFWSRWLPSDTVNTITRDGFYATQIRPGLKAVSLNTNFCHSKNFWLFINSTDPGQQLQWLVHELQMSELIDEKVHIIGHIPPGSEDCMKVWSKNYNRILRRFSRTITGQFFGHTHTNEFEMFYEQVNKPAKFADGQLNQKGANSTWPQQAQEEQSQLQQQATTDSKLHKQQRQQITSMAVLNPSAVPDGISANLSNAVLAAASTKGSDEFTLRPIGVGFVGPSVTTFVKLNPSFRIYNIDPKRDFMPTDFETYFMNLTAANLNASREPEWSSGGSFAKLFGIKDTSPVSIHDLLIDIANDFKDEDDGAGGDDDDDEPDDGSDDRDDDESERLEGDDRLFQLYWLFNSFSDTFTRAEYNKLTAEDKRSFLCRLFTGQSHDGTACEQFLPIVTMFKIASDLVRIK